MKVTRAGFLKRMAFAFTACAFFEMPDHAAEIKSWFQHSPHESAEIVAGWINEKFGSSGYGAGGRTVDWNTFYKEYTS